jgi:arylsulfatase A-like enzyme
MPFPRAKTSLYDSGIGAPLIVRWYGHFPQGSTQDGLISFVDLTPTILELADVPAPDDLQGQSMVSFLSDMSHQGNEAVFAGRNWHNIDDHIRCVRTERFKYIRNSFPGEPFGNPSDIVASPTYQAMIRLLDEDRLPDHQALQFRAPRPPEELYDLRSDPGEFRNVIYRPEYQDDLNKLRSLLDRWITDTGDVDPEKRFLNNINIRTGERYYPGAPRPRPNEWWKQHPDTHRP